MTLDSLINSFKKGITEIRSGLSLALGVFSASVTLADTHYVATNATLCVRQSHSFSII